MVGNRVALRVLFVVVGCLVPVCMAVAPSQRVEAAWPPNTTPKLYIYATRAVGDFERVTEAVFGESVILNWNVPDAQSCVVSANGFDLFGTISGPGHPYYGSIMGDTTFTLRCVINGATLTGSTTVRVVPIRADRQLVERGGNTIVRWKVTSPDPTCEYLVRANGYSLWGGAEGVGYTATYAPSGMFDDTTYTLVCRRGSVDTALGSTTVLVPASIAPVNFASMRGGSVFQGEYWFNDVQALMPRIQELRLNTVRLPVNLADAIQRGTEADLVTKLRSTLDVLNAAGMKGVVLLGAYSSLEWSSNPGCTTSTPTSTGGVVLSFMDVAPLAGSIVTALDNHPALLAYELQNEVAELPPAGQPVRCDPESKVGAVQAMYQLVKSRDPNVPTTVSEAWAFWALPRWNKVSSFLSYHQYSSAQTKGLPVGYNTASAWATQQASEIESIFNWLAKPAVDPNPGGGVTLPIVLGEWGHNSSIGEPIALPNSNFVAGNISSWASWGNATRQWNSSGYGTTPVVRGGSLRALNPGPGLASVYTDVASAAQSAFRGSVWLRSQDGSAVSGTVALWSLGGSNQSAMAPFTVSGPSWTEIPITMKPAVADLLASNTVLRVEVYISTVNKGLLIDNIGAWRGINDAGIGQIYQTMYCRMRLRNISTFFWALQEYGGDVYNPYTPGVGGVIKPSGSAIRTVNGLTAGC